MSYQTYDGNEWEQALYRYLSLGAGGTNLSTDLKIQLGIELYLGLGGGIQVTFLPLNILEDIVNNAPYIGERYHHWFNLMSCPD